MILLFIGTRPEAIKLAPVILELRARNLPYRVVFTNQQEMGLDFLKWFEIEPDFYLQSPSIDSLSSAVSSLILNIGKFLDQFSNSKCLALVQGDTNTALAAAQASFFAKIPIMHVEAGLRSEHFVLPFPEEANRRLISEIASVHFCPTVRAVSNLTREGKELASVINCGNTVVDSLMFTLAKLRNEIINSKHDSNHVNKKQVLVTLHRRENFGSATFEVCKAIERISDFEQCEVTWILHTNPQVRDVVQSFFKGNPRVSLIEPVPYFEMVKKLLSTSLLLTDSGGLQEEALLLRLPTLILRAETERPELVESGLGHVVGTDQNSIVQSIERILLEQRATFNSFEIDLDTPLGQGESAKKIVDYIEGIVESGKS